MGSEPSGSGQRKSVFSFFFILFYLKELFEITVLMQN